MPRLLLDRFFARAALAERRVLMLDFDGTLAPFACRPGDARLLPGTAGLLDQIMESPADRVVIVTGRCLEEAPPPLPLRRAPELWGSHGWQRRLGDSGIQCWNPSRQATEILQRAWECATRLARAGVRIERKRASVAVHWRGLEPQEATVLQVALRHAWRPLAARPQVQWMDFECGAELRARGRDKGTVVAEVLARESGPVAAAYVGDDRTDEDAFAAISGRGIGVLVSGEPRPSRAPVRLASREEVCGFLARWRDCAVRADA